MCTTECFMLYRDSLHHIKVSQVSVCTRVTLQMSCSKFQNLGGRNKKQRQWLKHILQCFYFVKQESQDSSCWLMARLWCRFPLNYIYQFIHTFLYHWIYPSIHPFISHLEVASKSETFYSCNWITTLAAKGRQHDKKRTKAKSFRLPFQFITRETIMYTEKSLPSLPPTVTRASLTSRANNPSNLSTDLRGPDTD